MDVYIIDPIMTTEDHNRVGIFAYIVRQQLEKYIPVVWINQRNINRYKTEISEESLIVVFNDKRDWLKEERGYEFLVKSKQCNALIWAVAMEKESRIPVDIISEKQSYDVWEQLRCRNLNDQYFGSIAETFARKIIARIMPTIYSEKGMIFVSHRRLNGEEICAKLCDCIQQQFKKSKIFRDVVEVEVGENAQKVIDIAMAKSDAFIFIHTEKSSESDWIQKELRYALLRNIPILWIQIDNADISKLKILPTEKPHLKYNSSAFSDEEGLSKITDEIVQTVFEMIMLRNNRVFGFLESVQNLFGNMLTEVDKTNLIYSVTVPRKNYHYPQREIKQYFQLYGKTPVEEDALAFRKTINKEDEEFDSALMLTDRIVKSQRDKRLVLESFEDFYYNWNQYLKNQRERKNMEIVISGAFPDGDEICKQSLTDALIIFAKSIIKEGYVLTFGSHPTFQELFFEVAKETSPKEHEKKLKMYISKWFEDKYIFQKEYFLSNAQLCEIAKENSISESLTLMRKKMIQRSEVIALVCLGGKIKENKNEEGIREEICLAKEFGIPVFLVGSVGGSSSEVALEYKKNCWKGLNGASKELNQMFMEKLDYFFLSQEMLKYLEK